MHPGLPQNLGHRTWQLHLDPPKLGVYRSLGTPCPGMTQAAHYLPGLPVRQGIIYPVFWAGFPGDPISCKDFGDGLGTSRWWLQLLSSQAFPYPLVKPNTAAWCSHLPFAIYCFSPTTSHTSALQSKCCFDLALGRNQATADALSRSHGNGVIPKIPNHVYDAGRSECSQGSSGSPVEQEGQAFSGCTTQQNHFWWVHPLCLPARDVGYAAAHLPATAAHLAQEPALNSL